MNAQGRKVLNNALNELAAATDGVDKLLAALGREEHLTVEQIEAVAVRCDTARSLVEGSLDEEQEKLDNMPESLSGSERAERLQEVIDALTQAKDCLEDTVSILELAADEINADVADRGSLLQDLEENVKVQIEEADSYISDAINA